MEENNGLLQNFQAKERPKRGHQGTTQNGAKSPANWCWLITFPVVLYTSNWIEIWTIGPNRFSVCECVTSPHQAVLRAPFIIINSQCGSRVVSRNCFKRDYTAGVSSLKKTKAWTIESLGAIVRNNILVACTNEVSCCEIQSIYRGIVQLVQKERRHLMSEHLLGDKIRPGQSWSSLVFRWITRSCHE